MVLKVLALDIEGGHGGSSKSLYTSILYLDQTAINVEVWCKRQGVTKGYYDDIGVRCYVKPDMPKVSALPKLSRNIFVHLKFLWQFFQARRFRAELLHEINDRFDVVHFNHEALAWLGLWLRPRTNAGFVFHNRTMLQHTLFARAQIRAINSAADGTVYITENEQNNARSLGIKNSGKVIYNSVVRYKKFIKCHELVEDRTTFKVCCLSNFSWNRGGDRLIEVAEILKSWKRTDVQFVMLGEVTLSGSLPGELGKIAKNGGNLVDYAISRGVGDMFLFLGHMSEPETVLLGCNTVAKPSRELNPWGRDILEGMAMGKPIIGIGSYEGFVKNGETGFLLPKYDAEKFAERIVYLVDNPQKATRMGLNARKLVEEQCNGIERAHDLTQVWQKVWYLRNSSEKFGFDNR